MYEDITYELIMKRMLNRISDSIDKREGSVIYNALAPAAAELQNMYIELDWMLNQSFADTQDREYLIKRCAERGIEPAQATQAVLKGVFNMDIPIGSRFSIDRMNYKAIEMIESCSYKMLCESKGEEGNHCLGKLIPIEYIKGLTSAELTEVLIPGEDEESTDHLRSRYFDSLNSKSFGGNIQDYKEKINALDGIGGVKVYPVWNGGGTVKLVIIDSLFSQPSDSLVESVQTEMDPLPNQGKGMGLAPIGHVVTVEPVLEKTIDVVAQITYQEGWTWEDVKPYAEDSFETYLKELRSSWADSSQLVVRISQIESRFLGLTGILDISGITINSAAANLTLEENEVPVKGSVNDGQTTT